MNILLLGSGGREHALAWKLIQSPQCGQLFIAPGNAGTARCGINVEVSPVDFPAVRELVLSRQIGLVVVGPEEPLVRGIVDFFTSDEALRQIPIIGPSAEGARLEGSKSFAKSFMMRHGIPTASYREFRAEQYEDGVAYLRQHPLPVVLKADGLAAGKGVLVCEDTASALAGFHGMLKEDRFGAAGRMVVVESFLRGIEASVFALTDGKAYLMLPEAKDYKRVGEGDRGLNTGGMGAVSPVPFFDEALRARIEERIVKPTVEGIRKEGWTYRGFLFFGLMIDRGEPYVIEYNCRMGDPETEVVMPRLQDDLVDLFLATAGGKLTSGRAGQLSRTAVTTMVVSGGYPETYHTGYLMEGTEPPADPEVLHFHAGTRQSPEGVLTAGGRVIAVTALGDHPASAADKSTRAASAIRFTDAYFRRDIGYEFR